MKSLDQEIIDARKPKCVWKSMLDNGNRLYVNLNYKANLRQTQKCQECNGYKAKRPCYFKETK